MSTKAKVYVGAVISAGAAMLLACAAADPKLPDVALFLQCLALAVLASTFKIRLPGMQSSISLNFVIFIVGIAGLSLFETILIAGASTVAQSLWRARTHPRLVQVAFNVAALIISIGAAFGFTAQLRNGPGHIPGLAIAGVIFFFVNTWLVSVVLSLVKGGSAFEIWRNVHRWSFPYYMMGTVVAMFVSAYAQICGWPTALAVLPCTYLLYAYYDARLKREAAGTERLGNV